MYRVRKENKEDIYIYGQLEDLQVISQWCINQCFIAPLWNASGWKMFYQV